MLKSSDKFGRSDSFRCKFDSCTLTCDNADFTEKRKVSNFLNNIRALSWLSVNVFEISKHASKRKSRRPREKGKGNLRLKNH